ncbi:MAG: 16S rRNA (adenine(1518)-N(6)/adenine(1519)-N(6))-dimethyltransferase RsmA [Magnetococcales bacterium]|nr:16S rRNA (adenine(1518)-N(6)/adenine(1519)-N(6))-dimethyltransferase RsmA [Magnetococcales bacterium]
MTNTPPLSIPHLVKSLGLHPKKGLGQNFLVDTAITQAIVHAAQVGPKDRVLEIGPGLGSLTALLLEQTKKLWAIEQDERMIPILEKRCQGVGELIIQRCDALKFDYSHMAQELGGPLRIVANLPYNISTPLLFHLLDHRQAIIDMTLMFQKEVAQRIAAQPGSKAYGTLSVQCAMWATVKEVIEVPPQSFFPKPKVDSLVIQLTFRQQPAAQLSDPHFFTQVVRAAFGQRRKTLNNALKQLSSSPKEWLERAEIDPKRRGETLSVTEFAHLSNCR